MSLAVHAIVPPTGLYVREDRCQTPVGRLKTIALRPPIDLLYAAGAFEAAGARCTVRDYPAEGAGADALAEDLRRLAPDLVLLTITTQTLADDMDVAALVKRVVPGVRVAAKGAHLNVLDREVLERWPALDLALRGEIEETCLEIGGGAAPARIAGITWRDPAGRIVRNPDRPFPADLDRLPHPARHLLDNSRYTRPDTGEPQTTVVTNRGCPFRCVYCLAGQVAGSRNRYRSVGHVLDELRECVERHGIRNFLFRSDLFTQDRRWVRALCGAIVDAGLDVRWACNSRVDTLDADTLAAMKRAGCWIVAFGVESGDQATLDRLGKHARVEDAFRAVALCRQAGIRSSVYLLVGLPWDTRESVAAQAAFARQLDPDLLEVFYPYPFPGTPLHRLCVEQGLMRPGEIPRQSYDAPAVPGLHLSLDEMRPLRRQVLRSFYLRPRTIVRTLGATRSAAELRNYARVGFAQLRDLFAAG